MCTSPDLVCLEHSLVTALALVVQRGSLGRTFPRSWLQRLLLIIEIRVSVDPWKC